MTSVISYGAIARNVGQMATLLEHWEDAERNFEYALALDEKMDHRPALALTRRDYADMLIRRCGSEDREKGRPLLAQALEAAREMGMAKVIEDCEGLLEW